MRALTLFLLAAFFFQFSAAQDSIVALSRFEEWTLQPGKTIRVQVEPLGNWGSSVVSLVKATDVNTGAKKLAVRISYEFDLSVYPVNTNALYLDASELDGVIATLTQFGSEVTTAGSTGQQMLTYTTLDGVQLLCRLHNGVGDCRFSRLYLPQKTPHVPSQFSVNRRRVPEVIALLQRAEQMIKADQ